MSDEVRSNLEREVRKYVNSKLNEIKIAKKGILIRPIYTEQPFPTVALAIYRGGKKMIEIPIYDLDKFVDTLNEVRAFLKLPIGKQVEEVEKSEEESEFDILGSVEFDTESELRNLESSKSTSKSNSKSSSKFRRSSKSRKTFDKNNVLKRLKDKR